MRPPLDARIAQQCTVVVTSQRSAGVIAGRYARRCITAGKRAWRSPAVLTLTSLIEALHTLQPDVMDEFLLAPEQAQVLWCRAWQDLSACDPYQVDSLARLAAEAWDTVRLWDLDCDPWRARAPTQIRTFLRVVARFEELCQARGARDRISTLARLTERSQLRTPVVGGLVCGADLYPAPPLAARLLSSLGADASEVCTDPAAAIPLREYANTEAEVAAAVAWAAQMRTQHPNDCIALIALEPASTGERLARALAECFPPSTTTPAYQAEQHLSLYETPMIATAVTLLSLLQGIHRQDLGAVLLSPYVGGWQAEAANRARLDQSLQARDAQDIDLRSLHYHCANAADGLGDLSRRVEHCLRQRASWPHRQTLHAWMQAFSQLLSTLGWPQAPHASLAEQQAYALWERVLQRVASLDAVFDGVSFAAALAQLKRLVRAQDNSAHLAVAPIQVVGLEAAAAIAPEHAWVLGLHDDAWPPRAPRAPFILTREAVAAGVPGYDLAHDQRRARQLLKALCAGAHNVILSVANRDQETPLRALRGLTAAPTAMHPSADVHRWPARWGVSPFARAAGHAAPLEPYQLGDGPPWHDLRAVRGGVEVLTDQAACPFRAYARHRLACATIEAAPLGLDPASRGDLVHAVLARVYQQLQYRDLGSDLAQDVVRDSVAAVVATRRTHHEFDSAFWAIEEERLFRLAIAWIAYDRQRDPFDIDACERSLTFNRHGLALRLRVDRIDRLSDGRLLLIDYKTGRVARSELLPPRPDQPQLPLYALALADEAVGAVAFAQLRPGNCALIVEPRTGLGSDDESVAAQWRERRAQWQGEIDTLIAEFLAGHATVTPKRGAQSCRYCELPLFCRIRERSAPEVTRNTSYGPAASEWE